MPKFNEYDNVSTLNDIDEFAVWSDGAVKNITKSDLVTVVGDDLNIVSGTFTPTILTSTNTTSIQEKESRYIRIGDIVIVSGMLYVTSTNASTVTTIDLELPIPSALSNVWDVSGTGTVEESTDFQPIFISAAGGTTTQIRYNPSDTNERLLTFTFTYKINAVT